MSSPQSLGGPRAGDTGGGIARLANVPDGQCRDGLPQLVILRKHPVVAMPVLPRWRDEIGEPVEELKRREFDDAIGSRVARSSPAAKAVARNDSTPRAMTCPPPWETGVLGAYRGGRSTLDMNGRGGRGKRHTTGCRFAVVRFRKRLGRGRRHDEGDEQDRSAAHGVDAGGSRRIL
jgi:hypothetical protein